MQKGAPPPANPPQQNLQPWQVQQYQQQQPQPPPQYQQPPAQQQYQQPRPMPQPGQQQGPPGSPTYVPAWQRQTLDHESSPEPICPIIPGLVCCIIVVILDIVVLLSVQATFKLQATGVSIGEIFVNRVTIQYTDPSNASATFTLTKRISEWEGIPGLEGLKTRSMASMGIAVINILVLFAIGIFQIVRCAQCVKVRRDWYTYVAGGSVVLVTILSIIGNVAILFLGRDDFPNFVRWLEGQMNQGKIEANPNGVSVILGFIAGIVFVVLLAFAIRTLAGRRCQTCCCDCCACNLAPDRIEPPIVPPAQHVTPGAPIPPRAAPYQSSDTVEGVVVYPNQEV